MEWGKRRIAKVGEREAGNSDRPPNEARRLVEEGQCSLCKVAIRWRPV